MKELKLRIARGQKKKNYETAKVVFLIMLTVVAQKVGALQSSDSVSTLTVPELQSSAESKTINVVLAVEYSSNLHKKQDPDRTDSATVIVNPSYMFQNGVSVDIRSDFIKEFQDAERAYVSDTVVVTSLPSYELIPNKLKYVQVFGVVLPTDDDRYAEESFRGSVSVRPRLIWDVSKKLKIANTFYLNRNIHKYERESSGEENIQYSVRNRVAIDYYFTEKLAVSLLNEYTHAWTYKSNGRESFRFSQEVSWEILKQTSLYMGHHNQGSIRGPGNSGTNVSAFDKKSSEIYGGISRVF